MLQKILVHFPINVVPIGQRFAEKRSQNCLSKILEPICHPTTVIQGGTGA
jgi:hypothetical protein